MELGRLPVARSIAGRPDGDIGRLDDRAEGGQGIGKSLLADILSRMVGHVNRSDVTADTLTNGFGDFLKARLITVDELYTVSGGMNRTGHSAYNSMKTYMAKTPEELTYRGEQGLLFKRDFGRAYLEGWPELVPLATGGSNGTHEKLSVPSVQVISPVELIDPGLFSSI